MSHIVILGTDLGRTMMAYGARAKLRDEDYRPSTKHGDAPSTRATWNVVCLAEPQILVRNVSWLSQERRVPLTKRSFEKCFLHKRHPGEVDTFDENPVLDLLDVKN